MNLLLTQEPAPLWSLNNRQATSLLHSMMAIEALQAELF